MHTSTTRSHTQTFSSRDALIYDHVDVARRVARKLARKLPPSMSPDEVEGAAFLGLTEAASRFDSSRGEPFIAYAVKRIRGAVLDELRRTDTLTRGGRRNARQIAEARRIVEQRNGGFAPAELVASELGLAAEDLARTCGRLDAAHRVSFDELGELASGDEAPLAAYAREQEKRAVARAIAELSERDRMIVSMYYGENYTLKEIGERLGVTESRACQLRARILARLRKAMAAGRR